MTLNLTEGPSHEYRIAVTIPLSGSDRVQSAAKAKISPLIDEFEAQVKALGLQVTVEDTTVKLKVKTGKGETS